MLCLTVKLIAFPSMFMELFVVMVVAMESRHSV